MAGIMKVDDTLNSNEGKGFVTINGKTRELFELTKLEAYIELIVSERKMLGHRMVKHKIAGAKGSGSITMYFNNSDILKEVINYIKTGKSPEISIQTYNEDPTSSVGRQEIVLRHVIIAKLLAGKIDIESEDGLTQEADFTFDDVDGLEYFREPNN